MSNSRAAGWDPGFYAIFDPEIARVPAAAAVAALLKGGATVVQLRAKRCPDGDLVQLARMMREQTRARGVPLVINDRLDIALLSDADGVHLGQEDISVADARALREDWVIGLSTHSLAQAQAAAAQDIDLIGCGPVFDTSTKRNPDATVGLATLADVVAKMGARPVVAIGGLDARRAQHAYDAGATFACAISAALAHDSASAIEEAARGFRRIG